MHLECKVRDPTIVLSQNYYLTSLLTTEELANISVSNKPGDFLKIANNVPAE